MKKNLLRIISSLLISASTVYVSAADKNPDWPKGINPETLLDNSDLEPDLNQTGFVDLFNGNDLTGWTVQGGRMLFEAQDGSILGTQVKGQPNGFLCTDKTYTDFIFTTEFKWEVLGNSGIMFRSGLKEQANNSSKRVFGYQSEMDDKERRWTGGIYGEAMGGWKYPLSKPEAHAAARAAIKDHSSWNRMTIYAKGPLIKTWINGVPCAHLINEERSEGIFGLQVHAGARGTIHWRNLRIKELAGASAWTDLFADGDFSQWVSTKGGEVPEGWQIENGVVHRVADQRPGYITTKALYENFELAFDWKISEGGNSGVKYRTIKGLGLEYQVLDDDKHKDSKNKTHRAASLYELAAAPDDKPLRAVGEWNQARIVARGPTLEHWLNGVKVVEVNQDSALWTEQFAHSKYRKNEGFGFGAGNILLQDHGDEVWFRNLRIRNLQH